MRQQQYRVRLLRGSEHELQRHRAYVFRALRPQEVFQISHIAGFEQPLDKCSSEQVVKLAVRRLAGETSKFALPNLVFDSIKKLLHKSEHLSRRALRASIQFGCTALILLLKIHC